MIIIDNTIISDDIKNKLFVCNLEKCKGACCVEGDLGAPLEKNETEVLEEIYPHVAPYLTGAGNDAIEKQGTWIKDYEDELSTPLIDGGMCAYAIYDEKNILKCGIEQAYLDGKIDYKKPISCHLYPIRIQEYNDFVAVNYHEWGICKDACSFGEELGVPVYKFLQEPLERKFGNKWYQELCEAIENKND